jgi:hypothetical protein
MLRSVKLSRVRFLASSRRNAVTATKRPEPVFFVHIERCGGTSTHDYLKSHLRRYRVLQSPSLFPNEPSTVLGASAVARLLRFSADGVGGHGLRAWPGALPSSSAWCMTVLRDPVDRMISHYRYHRDRLGLPWTWTQFLQDRRFHDWMTVRLAGTRDLDRAKEVLAGFGGVFFSETLDSGIAEISRRAGCDCVPSRRNFSRDAPDVLDEDRESAAEANELDLELFRWARQEFGPYRLVAEPGPGWRHRGPPELATEPRWFRIVESVVTRATGNLLSPQAPDKLADLVVDRSTDLFR